jgi:uncharacterized protein YndB with AHSA1/START domain
MENHIANANITINAPIENVWDALINPAIIKQYMFNTNASSDWKVGSRIIWKGEWNGKAYEDYSTILDMKPNSLLRYSHYSPLSGQPDDPALNPTVTIRLSQKPEGVLLELTQDNNRTEDAKKHSEQNWNMMLGELKKILER